MYVVGSVISLGGVFVNLSFLNFTKYYLVQLF